MQEWTQADSYRVKAVRFGSAVIYIRRPVLSNDEYRRRERAIQNALEAYGRTIK